MFTDRPWPLCTSCDIVEKSLEFVLGREQALPRATRGPVDGFLRVLCSVTGTRLAAFSCKALHLAFPLTLRSVSIPKSQLQLNTQPCLTFQAASVYRSYE